MHSNTQVPTGVALDAGDAYTVHFSFGVSLGILSIPLSRGNVYPVSSDDFLASLDEWSLDPKRLVPSPGQDLANRPNISLQSQTWPHRRRDEAVANNLEI